LEILLNAVVDPNNEVVECNDGNNQDAADTTIQCGGVN